MTAPFITSALLESVAGIRHGFFTRRGGVSTGIYDSLNVGRGSKDRPEDVAENRRRVAEAIGASALNTAYQVHSNIVVAVEVDFADGAPSADGVVTVTPGVSCGVLAADCAPILIVDPVARIVGAAHAGWKGALAGGAENAVAAMVALGGRAERMLAAVGPCIGPASYEVGAEFKARFVSADTHNGKFFVPTGAPEKSFFNLPAYVLERLGAAGVGAAEWVGADTAADLDFFSNRRAFKSGELDYGRLASVIVLGA